MKNFCIPEDPSHALTVRVSLITGRGPSQRVLFNLVSTVTAKQNILAVAQLDSTTEWCAVLKTEDAVSTLINARVASDSDGRTVSFHRLGTCTVRGKILWLPPQIPDSTVASSFASFGELSVQQREVTLIDGQPVASGARIIHLAFKDGVHLNDIPHEMEVAGFRILLILHGRPPFCLHCKCSGHIARLCPDSPSSTQKKKKKKRSRRKPSASGSQVTLPACTSLPSGPSVPSISTLPPDVSPPLPRLLPPAAAPSPTASATKSIFQERILFASSTSLAAPATTHPKASTAFQSSESPPQPRPAPTSAASPPAAATYPPAAVSSEDPQPFGNSYGQVNSSYCTRSKAPIISPNTKIATEINQLTTDLTNFQEIIPIIAETLLGRVPNPGSTHFWYIYALHPEAAAEKRQLRMDRLSDVLIKLDDRCPELAAALQQNIKDFNRLLFLLHGI